MKVVRELDHQRWSEFVYHHPRGSIFQAPEMYEVYKHTKNYEPFFFGVVSDTGEIHASMLAVVQREYGKFIGKLTSRAVVWGGPLVKDDDKSICAMILGEYGKIMRKFAIYSQFRNLWLSDSLKHLFTKNLYVYEDHLNILVDLRKPEDVLWKEMHSKRRNEIRRALKEGTYVRELVFPSEIEVMYDILREVYTNAKLPLADKSMFMAAFEILQPRGLSRYFGAFNNGNFIGVICLLTYKHVIYDWYAGSLRQYFCKYPNDVLPWEVFRWGKEQGFSVFDFGGAGKPDKEYGVRDYKKKFGGRIANFGRFRKIHQPVKYQLAKLGFKAWRCFRS